MTDSRGTIVLLERTAEMVRRVGAVGITWERAVDQVRHSSRVGRPKAVDALGALVEAGVVRRRGSTLLGAPPQLDEAAAMRSAFSAYKRRRTRRAGGRG